MFKSMPLLLLTLILSMHSYAQDSEIFKNDKEESSFYKKQIYKREVNLLTIYNDKRFISDVLSEGLQKSDRFSSCVLDINYNISLILANKLSNRNFFLLARRYNLIDDFILEQALLVSQSSINPSKIRETQLTTNINDHLDNFLKRSKSSCVLPHWQNYIKQLKGTKKFISNYKIKRSLPKRQRKNHSYRSLIKLKLQK
jgi:hypothetical protein